MDLTQQPQQIGFQDLAALAKCGMTHLEIMDLIHAVAIFAWANRLMLNLGHPVSI